MRRSVKKLSFICLCVSFTFVYNAYREKKYTYQRIVSSSQRDTTIAKTDIIFKRFHLNSSGDVSTSSISLDLLLAPPRDTLKYKTPTPLLGYKNPCFEIDFDDVVEYGKSRHDTGAIFRAETVSKTRGQRKCVVCYPMVYLMGVAKCGTTELTAYVQAHQSVYRGLYEVHYWNQDERPAKCTPPCGWHTTLLHYATMLRMNTLKHTLYYSGKLTYDVINYPDNVTHQPYGKDMLITDFTGKYTYIFDRQTIQKIHHFTPDARLLYSFRDPAERARSHLNYVLKFRAQYVVRFLEKWNTTTEGVSKRIHSLYVQSIKKYRNCLNVFCENYCATNQADGPDFFASTMENLIDKTLLNGLYHVFLKKQFEITPRKNVLVIDLGEFSLSPLYYMEEKILPFIGLPKYDAHLKEKLQKKNTPSNINRKSIVTFLPETVSLLRQFYSDSLNKLSLLLNGQTFSWYHNYDL